MSKHDLADLRDFDKGCGTKLQFHAAGDYSLQLNRSLQVDVSLEFLLDSMH